MKIAFVELAGFRGFKEITRFDLDPGFAVITGRNGVGKSSFFDAIDFALTGSINKYQVKGAKGGGLDNHIWWIGDGPPSQQYVSVGFVDEAGEVILIRRSRERGLETSESTVSARLCAQLGAGSDWAQTLMQTSLIRDETIAALSFDLSEQARFAAVQGAIGSAKGVDHSERTRSLLKTAEAARDMQKIRVSTVQADLGRALGTLTEVQSFETSRLEVGKASRLISSLLGEDFTVSDEAVAKLRRTIAERRISISDLQAIASDVEEILSDAIYFDSPEAANELSSLSNERRLLENSEATAAKRMDSAEATLRAERNQNALIVHLSSLLEHGEAVGLVDGKCPLCSMPQEEARFAMALKALRTQLAERGELVRLSAAELDNSKTESREIATKLSNASHKHDAFVERRRLALKRRSDLIKILATHKISAPDLDAAKLREAILQRREETASLEQALSILDASNAQDRISTSRSRVDSCRAASEAELAQLNRSERALELARQIDKAGKVVANELLTEQFDIVLPLLKELYLRLRPHSEWREIETDIAGHVRASLNFTVGDGKNPQFLFSSGQRRAAGIAFLLAIHLSRPWCALQTLLLDDPVQHIDDYRALNLVEVLSTIRRTGRQIIVAVEDPALADLLTRRLRSTASEGGRCFELAVAADGSAKISEAIRLHPLPSSVLHLAKAS